MLEIATITIALETSIADARLAAEARSPHIIAC